MPKTVCINANANATSAAGLSERAPAHWLWRRRAVKLVDGTGISMPDTPQNQAVYPQSSTQGPGLGFAQARLVVLICLATGAVLDMAVGPHRGKGSGELSLVRTLYTGFKRGDVMLADALYCNYFLIATLMAQGVDVLFEQNGGRITDFRRGQSLGTRDHLVYWPKPRTRPDWMTPEAYAQFPSELRMRETSVSHRCWSPRCWTTARSARTISQRCTRGAGTSSSTCATSRPPWAWMCSVARRQR
jgi:hypothetical protein